jgi:hypothetical protein
MEFFSRGKQKGKRRELEPVEPAWNPHSYVNCNLQNVSEKYVKSEGMEIRLIRGWRRLGPKLCCRYVQSCPVMMKGEEGGGRREDGGGWGPNCAVGMYRVVL